MGTDKTMQEFLIAIAYIYFEVIILKKHIFRDGKTYLEYFDNGVIYFDDQNVKKLVPGQTIEEFYALVHYYVINHVIDIW